MIKKRIRTSILRVCKICGEEDKQLGLHLRLIHSMKLDEYYLNYIEIGNKSNKCQLVECNNLTKFKSIDLGYSQFCSKSCKSLNNTRKESNIKILKDRNSDPKFKLESSIRCKKMLEILNKDEGFVTRRKVRMKEYANNPEVKSKLSKRFIEMHKNPEFKISFSKSKSLLLSTLHKDPEFKKIHLNNLYKGNRDPSRMNNIRNAYLNKAISKGIKEGIFYIMESEDYIKIGITYFREDLRTLKNRVNEIKPLKISLFKGSISDICELEYNIKVKYEPIKGLEYFGLELKSTILLEIKDPILPYSTQVI